MIGRLATFLERWLPWRWTQALRHGPHNVLWWLKGFPVVWIDPKRPIEPSTSIPPENAGTRRARALARLAALADWTPPNEERPS